MIKVDPSILSADYLKLGKDINTVDKGGANFIHIDIMDGLFVPSISFGPGWVKEIKPMCNIPLDVHMMVERPERYIETYAKNGANIIGVHVEATQHIHRALQMIKNLGKKAEVAINPGTPVEEIAPVLYMADQVLVMTVDPGFGGQQFIPQTVNKIKELSALRKEKKFNFSIEVDGGINNKTVIPTYEAGADVAVAGSYIFDSNNPAERIKSLKDATS